MTTQPCTHPAQQNLACPTLSLQPTALPPQVANQAGHIREIFRNFICRCDTVLSLLNSALTTEYADANTSNTSLIGYFVSNMSYHKNHQAANEIDALCMEAHRINQMMAGMGFMPLDTTFNGNAIRMAENNEHHFFIDWFTNGSYSSMASMNTARQIETTIYRVNNVRNQAQSMLYMLPPTAPCCA
jgi:hypothetical protein